uniref:Uncharacterized protein n=1 Tax=Anguilla anguilla TaxID=7936 RepID=A0A0E9S9W1_ANGAN
MRRWVSGWRYNWQHTFISSHCKYNYVSHLVLVLTI